MALCIAGRLGERSPGLAFQSLLGVHMAQAGPKSCSESGWEKLARGGSLGQGGPRVKAAEWIPEAGPGAAANPGQAGAQASCPRLSFLLSGPAGQAAPGECRAAPWRPGGQGPNAHEPPVPPLSVTLLASLLAPHI